MAAKYSELLNELMNAYANKSVAHVDLLPVTYLKRKTL